MFRTGQPRCCSTYSSRSRTNASSAVHPSSAAAASMPS
jgi:hypothetical protein